MGKRKGRDDMAVKSANLYARIEPDVKEQAEEILATLGIPASNAINMFYKQIILNRGLPFEVKIPTARPVDISRMNAETLDMELEKGYADMQAGRTKSAAQVFTDIRRDYNVSTTHDLKVMGLELPSRTNGLHLRPLTPIDTAI